MKIGDVVQLQAGGVRMTVESMSGDSVTCVWFDHVEPKRASFKKATLKPIDMEGKGDVKSYDPGTDGGPKPFKLYA